MKRTNYWLLKSEPHVFSIDDLIRCHEHTDWWNGVRNHQAKNFMLEMKKGDQAFFYHSNARPSGIVGVVSIRDEAIADPEQFNAQSAYFDPRARLNQPIWCQVSVQWNFSFKNILSLSEIKKEHQLKEMMLLKQSRLSISKVTQDEWYFILNLMERKHD